MNRAVQYFERIQSLILRLSNIIIERYEEQVLSKDRGNLRIRVRFYDNSLLEISEAIHFDKSKCNYLSYRHHYQKSDGSIIFRYDNCPHHPEASTYPEHKHTKSGVISSNRPDIEDILSEAEKSITN